MYTGVQNLFLEIKLSSLILESASCRGKSERSPAFCPMLRVFRPVFDVVIVVLFCFCFCNFVFPFVFETTCIDCEHLDQSNLPMTQASNV